MPLGEDHRIERRVDDAHVGPWLEAAARALVQPFLPPYEGGEVLRHLFQFGLRSVPLIATSGFAIGIVQGFA